MRYRTAVLLGILGPRGILRVMNFFVYLAIILSVLIFR